MKPPRPTTARQRADDAPLPPETILAALRKAGTDGLTAAGLRLHGKTPAAAGRRDALAALVTQNRVASLGAGKAVRYFLAENAPTAVTAAARLLALGEASLGDGSVVLWREAELRLRLPAPERTLLGPALDHLQAERQIVPLRQGRSAFFAFAVALRGWLDTEPEAASAPEVTSPDEDDATLFFAYARLVRESGGFPDVKIALLQRALAPTAAAALGPRLVGLWREGRATLSLGDWSLASAEMRAAAVELDGDKYLLVRLDDASA